MNKQIFLIKKKHRRYMFCKKSKDKILFMKNLKLLFTSNIIFLTIKVHSNNAEKCVYINLNPGLNHLLDGFTLYVVLFYITILGGILFFAFRAINSSPSPLSVLSKIKWGVFFTNYIPCRGSNPDWSYPNPFLNHAGQI